MTLSYDFSHDYQYFDTLVTGSITPKPTGSVVNNVSAIQGQANQRKLVAAGLFSPQNTYASWSLYAATLGSYSPKPCDIFNDGTSDWFLEDVTYVTLDQVWLCQSRKRS